MPNWCSNRVEIYIDDEETMKEFQEFIRSKDQPLSFNSIVPMPEELEGTQHPPKIRSQKEVDNWKPESEWDSRPITQEMSDKFKEEYGTDNWFDWCCNNWGTKWDAQRIDFEADGNYITMHFDTAWGPPEEIHDALNEKFGDKISISWFYDEPGCQIAGYLGA